MTATRIANQVKLNPNASTSGKIIGIIIITIGTHSNGQPSKNIMTIIIPKIRYLFISKPNKNSVSKVGVPTAGKFLARYGLIPVIVPWDDVEVAMQTGELDGVCWCGFTEAYEVGWADICKYALTNSVTGAWFGSYFANQKSWDKLSPKLQALYRMSINDSHYYRQVWYWGGEADLRVNGKKMELTSLPANEWGQVVKDSEQFWDETSKISPRAKKVVDAFKLYAATMEKAGYPYR